MILPFCAWPATRGSRVSAGGNNTVIANNTYTTITNWASEFFDTLNEFDPATGIFTAKHAGFYYADCGLLFNAVAYPVGTHMQAAIRRNNLTGGGNSFHNPLYVYAAVTTYIHRTGFGLFQLAAGDNLRVVAYHNQGGNVGLINQDNRTFFHVFAVQPLQ